MKSIILIGFMGCGKSTVARLLSEETGLVSVDLDAYIESMYHEPIPRLFELYGEDGFRDRETEAIRAWSEEPAGILACGGGAVLRDENVAMLKERGSLILLTAAPETIYERVKSSTNRPILNGHMNVAYISSLMEKRKARYEQVCDVSIATDRKHPRQIASEILKIVAD